RFRQGSHPRRLGAPLRSCAKDLDCGAGSKRRLLRPQRDRGRLRLGVGAEHMGRYAGLKPSISPIKLCAFCKSRTREEGEPSSPVTPNAPRFPEFHAASARHSGVPCGAVVQLWTPETIEGKRRGEE